MATVTVSKTKNRVALPVINGRVSIWEKVKGMWKNRKPDPIQELTKLRKGWERQRGTFMYPLDMIKRP